jgi:hypothetical protein
MTGDPKKPDDHPGQGQGPATTPPGHGGTPPGQHKPKPDQDLPDGPKPDQGVPQPQPAPKK